MPGAEEQSIGKVVQVSGQVTVRGDEGVRSLDEGDAIFKGDMLVTAEDAGVEVEFSDDTRIDLDENSQVEIDEYVYDSEEPGTGEFLMDMGRGAMRCVSGEIADQNPDEFNVQTPLASIGIRGTVFGVHLAEDGQADFWVEELGKGHSVVFQDKEGRVRVISESDKGFSMIEGENIIKAPSLDQEQIRTLSREVTVGWRDGTEPPQQGDEEKTPGEEGEEEGEAEEGEEEGQEQGEEEREKPQKGPTSPKEGKESDETKTQLAPDLLDEAREEDTQGTEEEIVPAEEEEDTASDYDFLEEGEEGTGAEEVVEVEEENTVPEADSFSVTIKSGYTYSGKLKATDVDGDVLSFNVLDAPEHAHDFSIDSDGGFVFLPNKDFEGGDDFKFEVMDSYGNSDTATVTVNVEENKIHGDNSPNYLQGKGGMDDIYGYAGDDTLQGKAGDDYLDGGENSEFGPGDMATYKDAPSGIDVDPTSEDLLVRDGYGDTDDLDNIEYIYGSPYADNLEGDGLRELDLEGAGGDDTIDGGVTGSSLNYQIGGVSYAHAESGVVIDFSAETNYDSSISVDNEYGGNSYTDTVKGVETLIGSYFGDTITGHENIPDSIIGLKGADNLNGGSIGADSWNELMLVGNGGSGIDLQYFTSSNSGSVTDSWGDSDTIQNFNEFEGTEYSDTFELFESSTSYDWIFEDTPGNDTYRGNTISTARVAYNDNPSGISMGKVEGNYIVHDGWGGEDTLDDISGIEGTDFNDSIIGNDTLENTLLGMEGQDTLDGNNDSFTDSFVLTDASSWDIIKGFELTGSIDDDLVEFDETKLDFNAQGTTNDYADVSTNPDTSQVKVMGFNQNAASSFNPGDVASMVNNEINHSSTADSYFVVSDGTDSRIYTWSDDGGDDQVQGSELNLLCELQGINENDISADMDGSNFQIAT